MQFVYIPAFAQYPLPQQLRPSCSGRVQIVLPFFLLSFIFFQIARAMSKATVVFVGLLYAIAMLEGVTSQHGKLLFFFFVSE